MESYNNILARMNNAYKDTTGYTPDEYSDTGIRMRILAGEVFNLCSNIDWLKKQLFATTAEGEYLDYHAEERGLKRKEALKACGYVSFAMEYTINTDTIIPKGTVVSTDDDIPLRFITTAQGVIKAGSVHVEIPVVAEYGGKKYNVATGTVVCAITSVQNIIQVYNKEPMQGGADEENDEKLRERILYIHNHHNNSTNTAYYRSIAEGVSGVYSAGVIPKNRGVGTVDVFINSQSGDASTELIEKVQSVFSTEREVNVNVLVRTATKTNIVVHIYLDVEENYSFDEVKAEIESVSYEYINSLGVGNSFYLSNLAVIIKNIEGVKGFIYDFDDSYDVLVNPNVYPYLYKITVDNREDS